MQPDVARRYLQALELIRRHLSEAELARALRSGSVERLLTELMSDKQLDGAFSGLRSLIDRESLTAAEGWMRDLPKALQSPFDTLNPRVLDAVRSLDTRVIAGLKAEVRETVRQAATAGLEAGQGPRVVARSIRESLGLPPNQEQAVRNFRTLLESGDKEALTRALRDRRFDSAIRRGNLSAEQIERMASAYRKRFVAFNAETHARSIALDSQRLAQRNSWENAIAQGTVDRNRLVRRWVSVGDDRVRPEHQRMHGQETSFDAPYSNGQMVPGESDYNCRCIERIILRPAMRLAA